MMSTLPSGWLSAITDCRLPSLNSAPLICGAPVTTPRRKSPTCLGSVRSTVPSASAPTMSRAIVSLGASRSRMWVSMVSRR